MERKKRFPKLFRRKIRTLHDAVRAQNLTAVKKLLRRRDTNLEASEGEMGETALHVAADCGTAAIAVALMNNGANTEALTRNDWTPLHKCARHGTTDVAVALMDKGVNLEAKNKYGFTPLHVSAYFGTADMAVLLMERGANLEAKGEDGYTPLHMCAVRGTVDVAEALLDKGADVESIDNHYRTPLHRCAMSGGSVNMAMVLMEREANIEARMKYFRTPLHLCAESGNVDVAKALLERGANTEVQDHKGFTSLHLCAYFGTANIAMALMDKGANVNARAGDSFTPLHFCARTGNVVVATALLDKGANIEALNGDMDTALHVAAHHGHLAVLRLLLKRGARADLKNQDGNTALHTAVENQQLETVYLLLERAADVLVHIQNNLGYTALHIAVGVDSESLVQVLLNAGAPSNIKDNEGMTPLDCVKEGQESLWKAFTLQEKSRSTRSDAAKQAKAQRQRVQDFHQSGDVSSMQPTMMPLPLSASYNTMGTSDSTSEEGTEDLNAIYQRSDAMVQQHQLQANEDGYSSSEVKDIHPKVTPQTMPESYGMKQAAAVASDKGVQDLEIDVKGTTAIERNQLQTDEGGSSSWSTDSDEWYPNSPYGSRSRMLKGIEPLKSGCSFADDYVIDVGNIAGKPHVRFAQQRYTKRDCVVLKFYCKEALFENAIKVHSEVAYSEHVCRIVQTLRTSKTGFPPCIVFERGLHNLCDWIKSDRSLFDRKWCLHQILASVEDVHSKGIVHGSVKPSNIVFFAESVRWKLIDLDGACKAGELRAGSFTASYAAPEILQELQDSGHVPIAQPSSDIWSLGIVVYEVLTGERFFGGDITPDEIHQLSSFWKVEERMALVENDAQREAISKFLKIDPRERWSVTEALQHCAFHSDTSTTTLHL